MCVCAKERKGKERGEGKAQRGLRLVWRAGYTVGMKYIQTLHTLFCASTYALLLEALLYVFSYVQVAHHTFPALLRERSRFSQLLLSCRVMPSECRHPPCELQLPTSEANLHIGANLRRCSGFQVQRAGSAAARLHVSEDLVENRGEGVGIMGCHVIFRNNSHAFQTLVHSSEMLER